jgi:hypothetical protein
VCRHHLLRVLRWRRAQVGHAVLVELIDDPQADTP